MLKQGKYDTQASNVVCGVGGGAGHVWFEKKPHKGKFVPRLLNIIEETIHLVAKMGLKSRTAGFADPSAKLPLIKSEKH